MLVCSLQASSLDLYIARTEPTFPSISYEFLARQGATTHDFASRNVRRVSIPVRGRAGPILLRNFAYHFGLAWALH